MRPDLIRFLVDTRRKKLITHIAEGISGNGGSVASYSTVDRVGLSAPLAEDVGVKPAKKVVPKSVPVGAEVDGVGAAVVNGK